MKEAFGLPFQFVEVSNAKKKSACIAEQIVEVINAGEYTNGDKLPSERKIAEAMGVSRVPVREALSALQLAGVVESVSGNGTYVRKSGKLPGSKSLALMVLEKGESPFDALRARKVLELGVVDNIIDTLEHETVPGVEEALEHMTQAVEELDLDAYFESNREFHLALVRATGNPILERSMEYLLNVMDQPLWMEAVQKHFAVFDHVKEYVERHKRIYAAICARDKDKALKEVRDHFDQTVEEVKAYL